MTLEGLRAAVAEGSIDTVAVGVCDMQGRLQGKRFTATHFLEAIAEGGTEACSYLLAVDVEMNTVDGFQLSSWDQGYGDLALSPDLSTLRLLPWQERTALCLADVRHHDGAPVSVAPRSVLAGQLDRLERRGWSANAASELEFIAFRDDYRGAWESGYRDLTPAVPYNADYSLLDTAGIEPLLRSIRRGMEGAGLQVESSKGECNLGQQEISFRYRPAMRTADDHVVYKTGAKEIAAQQGMAITFIAKYDAAEGNSCHIHLSLVDADGEPAFAADPLVFSRFLAGQLACLPDFTLLYAPNVNSYKRLSPGSFAPTAVAWGRDNRTCAFRSVGSGAGLRIENRVPGGDVNPYLAIAAMIAAGLHGIEAELELGPELVGNAYSANLPRVPHTLQEARDRFAASPLAEEALGAEVIAHYGNPADVERADFGRAVTDWELRRGFERL